MFKNIIFFCYFSSVNFSKIIVDLNCNKNKNVNVNSLIRKSPLQTYLSIISIINYSLVYTITKSCPDPHSTNTNS